MREQHALVGDRDDVVVERAGGDRFLRLLGEDRPLGIEPVQPRDRLRRLDMLARREGAARHAIDEDLDAGLAMRRRQPHVIGRALVAERRRDRRVDREMRAIAKATRSCASVAGHSWLRCGMVRRLATVRWHLPSAVSGAGETVAAFAAHIAEADIALAASAGSASSIVVPSSASQARWGRGCGRKMPCAKPEREVGAHLVDALRAPRARGCDTCPAWRIEARLPRLSPA